MPQVVDNMLALNAFDPESAAALDPLIARRRKAFGDAVPLFYEEPVHFVRGEGVWLFDAAGNRYLDAYNNVPAVGHCHPHVVKAVAEQAATLNTHTRYLSEVVTGYAERLLATFPDALSNVLFTSSGTESVDLAMRLARAHTGGEGFIVTRFAYHGNSAAVAAITPAFGPGVPLGAHVRTVCAPLAQGAGADVEATFAAQVGEAIADLERHGIPFAGLILDTICSSDGVFVEPAGFLRSACEVVRAARGVFIADEVQPGFGRTGVSMWGFERHGISPDIVVLGKPMGNGMPIAATVTRPDIMRAFTARSGYFNTFGGNTVCCAAAAAVLDVIEQEGLRERAAHTGEYLSKGFRSLASRHGVIKEVRGTGLYLGVELTEPDSRTPNTRDALWLVNALRRRHILISTCGPAGNVLKIRPPLPFSTAHCDLLLGTIDDLLAERRC